MSLPPVPGPGPTEPLKPGKDWPDRSKETFGERLARLRCERKPSRHVGTKGGEWTQAWLARELGHGQSLTVWLWENDRRTPDATMMARLATLLGCSEHYLRYGTEEPRVQTLEVLREAIREGQTLEFLRAIAGVP
jgi:transcriptional regulator with XRE-family HTH domain